jgi:hypothetical protein
MDKNIQKTLDKISNNPNLFFPRTNIQELYNLANSIDIHLLFVGKTGIGKFATIFHLLNKRKTELNYNIFKHYDNKPSKSDEILLDKILFFDNIFIFDFAIITSNELSYYFDFIRSINSTYNLDGRKKIIIGRHINELPLIFQKQLGKEMEKSIALFWLTTSNYSNINMKIRGTSALVKIPILTKEEFLQISYWKLSSIYRKKWGETVNNFYSIYVNNNYHMGYTLAQIKWNLTEMKNGSIVDIDIVPIQHKIIFPLITSLAKLSSINKLENIKNHLSGLLALNINPNMIIQICVDYYLNLNLHKNGITKLDDKKKMKIVELGANSSKLIARTGKHLVILETFCYQIIDIYFNQI